MKLVKPQRLTEEEHRLLFTYLGRLTNDPLRDFLKRQELPSSGVKEELLTRIKEELAAGQINYTDLIFLLDRSEPWSKQHVYLYGPPRNLKVGEWADIAAFRQRLRKARLLAQFNNPAPLFLPEELSITEISHKGGVIRITAVEKRVAMERNQELDQHRRTGDGHVFLKAYVETISRGFVVFEWNLRRNVAMIQVSQLPSYWKYEAAVERLQACVASLITFSEFSPISLHKAIAMLHRWTAKQRYPLRYHEVEYQKGGRSLAGKSATSKDPLPGDPIIDSAMDRMRDEGGVATGGNFYFLKEAPGSPNSYQGNDVHAIIVASRGRVNFPASNDEEGVRYAIKRIREASQ